MFFKIIKKYIWQLLLLVLVLIGILMPNPLTFITGSYLAFYLAGSLFPRSFLKSYLGNLIVGFTITSSIIAFLGIFFWVLTINIHLKVLYILTIVIISISSVAAAQKYEKNVVKSNLLADLITFGLVITVIGVIFFGVFYSYRGKADIQSIKLQTISYGIDDISHLNMYKDTVEADQGLILGSRNILNVSKKGNAAYPKMSHLIVATYSTQLTNNKSNEEIINSYLIAKITVFILSIAIICLLSFESIAKKSKRTELSLRMYIGSIILLYSIFILIIPFFQEGFFSVWPILIMGPVLICSIMDYGNKQREKYSSISIIILGLTASTLMMSWPIAAIPAYIAIAILLISDISTTRKIDSIIIKKMVLAFIFCVPGLAQLATQYLDKNAAISTSQINEPGGIIAIPIILVLLFFMTSLYSILKEKISIQATTSMMAFLLSSSLLLGLVAFINQYSTGSLQYFYYKTSQLFLILFIFFVAPSLVALIFNISGRVVNESFGRLLKLLIATTMLAILLIFSTLILFQNSTLITSIVRYSLAGERKITRFSAQNLVSGISSSNLDNTSVKRVYVNQDNPLESYYMTSLQRALTGFDPCIGEIESLIISNASGIEERQGKACSVSTRIELEVIDEPNKDNLLRDDVIRKILDYYRSNSVNFTVNKLSR